MNNTQMFLENIENFSERARSTSHLQKELNILKSEMLNTKDFQRKKILGHACLIISSEISVRQSKTK